MRNTHIVRHGILIAAVVMAILSACIAFPVSPTPTLIVLPTLPPSSTSAEVAVVPASEEPGIAPTIEGGASPVTTEVPPVAETGTVPQASAQPLPTSIPLIHVVKPGETLIYIASLYGVSPDLIKAYNHISNSDLIFVGQQLVIPPAGAPLPTEAGAPQPTVPVTQAVAPSGCTYDATFVADVTIPDNTVLQPGQPFVKTWRIRNSGTCPWIAGVTLNFLSGQPMGAQAASVLPYTAVGADADVSLTMTAPIMPGQYNSTWTIKAPDGHVFGTQPFMIINVTAGGAVRTPIPESPSSATPPPAVRTSYPAVSGITYTSRQIFLNGKSKGNRANVFAKVGDSLSDEFWFLHPIGEGQANWHNYDYLSPAADFFGTATARTSNSFDDTSVATHGGWDSFSPLDPANSTPYDFCGNDSPIVCEYRTIKPSVGLIMLGTNEASDHLTSGSYEQNLRRMVQISIDMGVIPVLYTIPWNKFRDPRPFNDVITRVARSYDIPLVDYWSIVDSTPNHGIGPDDVHPSVPPDHNTANFTDDNLQYGYTVRNLLTMQALDSLWRQVLAY